MQHILLNSHCHLSTISMQMFVENKKAVPAQRSHPATAVDLDAWGSFLKNSIDRTSVDA